jgi:two-component system sensor histidine kinase QseC
MVRSIRSHLLINLVISIAFVAFTLIAINLLFIDKEFTDNLNAKLISDFVSVRTIYAEYPNVDFSKTSKDIVKLHDQIITQFPHYHEFVIESITTKQVWSKDGKLLAYLPVTPSQNTIEKLPNFFNYPQGFSTINLGNMKLRVFVYHDDLTQKVYAIYDTYGLSDVFDNDFVIATILTLFGISILIGLLFWLIVTKELTSLTKVTDEVKRRLPNNLTPVDITEIPKEIRPLAIELNNLFIKLQEAFVREKRFASDAAHELKTPLAALKIQAQVALNTENIEELRSALKNIVKGVDRSTHIINQLLTLSRALPEASIKKELVSLNKEASIIIAESLLFAKQKNIEIELIAPDRIQYIEGNPITIGVLIRNLVDNAIRYTPNNGLVQVLIEEKGSNVILKVVDTGKGIPEQFREKVFDRFFRVLGTEETGCGLGLSIVKQIAQHHDAEIKVSTPPSGIGLEIAVIFKKPSLKTLS